MALMQSLMFWGTFLLKRIEDFCRFGVCLEILQKLFKTFLIILASWGDACPQMIRSSGNIREWIGGQLGPKDIPAS